MQFIDLNAYDILTMKNHLTNVLFLFLKSLDDERTK